MSDEHIEEGMSVQPKLYELGYLLAPLIASESLEGETAKIKEIVGEAKAEGAPKMQRLAYAISKKIGSNRHEFDDAYFGWVKFEATPERMSTIKKELDKLELMVRYLLIHSELTDYDLNPPAEEASEGALNVMEDEVAVVKTAKEEGEEKTEIETSEVTEEEKAETPTEDSIDKEIDKLLERGEF